MMRQCFGFIVHKHFNTAEKMTLQIWCRLYLAKRLLLLSTNRVPIQTCLAIAIEEGVRLLLSNVSPYADVINDGYKRGRPA